MEDDEPFDLETAWAGLQHAIGMLLAVVGGCALAVAERMILTRAARTEILQWLAPLEAFARRLLVVEALNLPAPNQPADSGSCHVSAVHSFRTGRASRRERRHDECAYQSGK